MTDNPSSPLRFLRDDATLPGVVRSQVNDVARSIEFYREIFPRSSSS